MNQGRRLSIWVIVICFAGSLLSGQLPISRADILKEVTKRLDTVAKKLNLSPDQINRIKPLLAQQMEKGYAARAQFASSDKSDAARQRAIDAIRESRANTNGEIKEILTPSQSKQWDDIVKGWKDDANLGGLGKFLAK